LYYNFLFIYKNNHHNTGGYFEWTWPENSCELPIPEPPTVPGQPPALAALTLADRVRRRSPAGSASTIGIIQSLSDYRLLHPATRRSQSWNY
jgi:hypothetical protein